MFARIVFFLLGVSFALGSPLSYGPVITNLGCDRFTIVPPNPNLFPSTPNTYYYVYGTDTSYGFSSGEIYTNSLSQFMNVADSQGFLYWSIGSPSQWSPAMGTLYVPINLYSNPARTNQYLIGSGNFSSADFFAHNFTDSLSPHGWVVAVGGNVTLSYDITVPSALKNPDPSFTTTVFQSRTVNMYFPPNRNMWTNKETFTNRFFSRADAATFSAPLFDSSSSQHFWNSGVPLAPYNALYSNLIQLWGSNGFNFANGQYTSPNVGMDVALGLSCSGLPPVIHITPPPCPQVPDCTGCTTLATVSGMCSEAIATTQANCLTFTVDDTQACTASTSSVQV